MKRFAFAAILALASVMTLGPATPVIAQPSTDTLTIPITGTGAIGSFTGSFTLQRFTSAADGVAAVGRLVGTVVDAAGVATSIVRTVTLPVAVPGPTCEILHLDLGPLNLDLLGLDIDLSRIVLDITAESGAGNLLGNLLCGVAGLLDNPAGLAKLLNQVLSVLE